VSRPSLVIGASGQVGEHCLAALQNAVGTYRRHARPGLIPLDVTDRCQFEEVVERTRPGVIYFTAAVANVDYCESHPDVAYETNVAAVAHAVESANRHRCKLVYFSSEYVFDGAAGPYLETAPTNPISVYGRQKLAAEEHIAAFADNWLVVRTAVVYSWESQGKNFIYRLRSALCEGKPIAVPSDQISSPTYGPDLARAVIQLAEQDERGIYNVTGPRVASRVEFARAAARAFGLDATLITPVLTPDLRQPARRPLNAGLIVDKAERALRRPLLDFDLGLRQMAASQP
jgi:dTDP-4-dehydrorhamnose reductase